METDEPPKLRADRLQALEAALARGEAALARLADRQRGLEAAAHHALGELDALIAQAEHG